MTDSSDLFSTPGSRPGAGTSRALRGRVDAMRPDGTAQVVTPAYTGGFEYVVPPDRQIGMIAVGEPCLIVLDVEQDAWAIGEPPPIPEPTEGPELGELKPFVLAPANPKWQLADGRPVTSAMGWPHLRAGLIARTYPYGMDGSGNPRLPDFRDRALVGAGPGHPEGHAFGAETHTLTAGQSGVNSNGSTTNSGAGTTGTDYPDHIHTITLPGPSASSANNGTGGAYTVYHPPWNPGQGGTGQTVGANTRHQHSTPAHSHPLTGRSADQAHPNTQPSLATPIYIRILP